METVKTIEDVRDRVVALRRQGDPVALTMATGVLHGGHAGVIRAALGHGNRVVSGVFAKEMARTKGIELIQKAQPDILFAPPLDTVFPDHLPTRISVDRYVDVLCSIGRPGYFDLPMLAILKAVNIVQPDKLYLTQRDWQQMLLVRRLMEDLNVPVEVVGCQIARDGDGLAMSGQNHRLTADQRAIAPRIFQEISRAASRVAQGEPSELACVEASENLIIAGFSRVEYLECRDARTLRIARAPGQGARVFVAAMLGEVRLIDNVPVPVPQAAGL